MAVLTDLGAIGIVVLLWAGGYLFFRVGEGKNIFRKQLFWTYLIWAMLNFVVMGSLILSEDFSTVGNNQVIFLGGAAIWTSLSLVLWKSLEKTSIDTLALVTAAYPFATAVLVYFVLGEGLSLGAMFAIGTAIVVGVLLAIL